MQIQETFTVDAPPATVWKTGMPSSPFRSGNTIPQSLFLRADQVIE